MGNKYTQVWKSVQVRTSGDVGTLRYVTIVALVVSMIKSDRCGTVALSSQSIVSQGFQALKWLPHWTSSGVWLREKYHLRCMKHLCVIIM